MVRQADQEKTDNWLDLYFLFQLLFQTPRQISSLKSCSLLAIKLALNYIMTYYMSVAHRDKLDHLDIQGGKDIKEGL